MIMDNEYYFDVFMYYNVDTKNYYKALRYNHLKEIYPYDTYGITFCYDKNLDKENCILIIESIWYDLTSLANSYYQDNNLELGIKKLIISTLPKYIFKGTFTECDNLLTKFIENITN